MMAVLSTITCSNSTSKESKLNHKDLCMAFLDISNAFGDIPHSAIFHALKASGAGSDFCDLVEDAYTDISTSVLTNSGMSSPISIHSGVRQGCPMSGPMFNIAIDPLLRLIQVSSIKHRIMAYADDLVLLASSRGELRELLVLVSSHLGKIRLSLNLNKCCTYHIHGKTPVSLLPTAF